MPSHKPEYGYCPDPDNCCWNIGPVNIVCAVDGQPWPCEVKRAHHTEPRIARIERWVTQRVRQGYV